MRRIMTAESGDLISEYRQLRSRAISVELEIELGQRVVDELLRPYNPAHARPLPVIYDAEPFRGASWPETPDVYQNLEKLRSEWARK